MCLFFDQLVNTRIKLKFLLNIFENITESNYDFALMKVLAVLIFNVPLIGQ